MQLDLLKNLEQYTKRNRRRSIWRKIVRFLACIVVFCTTYALILPALTMEQPTFCNHEEHVHTEDCYIQLDASANLICTPEVHTHNELCFDEFGNIICGVADYLGHTHTEECYGEDGTLICTIPETVWHVHDESCLVPAQPKLICGITEGDIHFHDDSCYTINITINNNQIPTEDIAHVHSVVCYDELGNLICGLEGSVYHVHGTECYDEFGTLICLLEETAQETGNNDLFSTSEDRTLICTLIEGEGHGHTELCYEAPETEFILGCAGNIPTHTHNELCFDEFGNIICGMSENIAHIHDSVYCYDANGNLVCPLLETAEHVHTAECFAAYEQPLTCVLEENEEHTHSNLCYGTWQFICTADEHTHDLACYSDPSADVETAQDWEEMLSSVSLTGVWADDVVEIAKSQIGYVESELNYAVSKDGVTPLGYTRYGEWFGVPYDEDWSAAFASFCLSYAKVEGMAFDSDCAMWVETLSAGWQDLYRNANEYTPVRGDLVFFDIDGDTVADRVGILAEIAPASENAPETLLVIEGDCFNQVQYMTYELGDASIIGYSMLPEQEPLANTYDYFDGIVDVKVEIPADSGIPEDAVLRVTPIDVTDSNYLNLLASAEVAVDGTLSRAQFYDISFYTADLEYIPVGETARVTMRFAEGVITPNADTLVLHYEDNESTPTVIEGVSISQEIVLNASTFNVLASVIETTETVLTFETDGFSVFGVVEVETFDGEVVDVYSNTNGYTDLISADPWVGFGVGTSTPSEYSVGTISIEEIREIVANGGATYNMIFSGSPGAAGLDGPQVHFSAWNMPTYDENGNPIVDDNGSAVTAECELYMALTQLSNGKYLATIELDDLLDLFTSGKFGTKTIDDITNLTVQIYTTNFVLYDAWFEIPDTCDNLENGIETDLGTIKNANESLPLLPLDKTLNTGDTVVLHFTGNSDGAFRYWLSQGANTSCSVQTTVTDSEFDILVEVKVTADGANNVQFKGPTYDTNLNGLNITHCGVFYGTMAEYEAAIANGGIDTPPEEALLTDCTLEDDIAETKQYYDNDTIILYTLPTPLEFNSDQKTVVVHFTGTTAREFRTWLCNSSSNTLSSVQYSHSVDNGEIHADGTFDIIKEYVFSTNTEGNNTQAAYFEFKGTSGNTTPLSDLNISHVGVFYGTMEEYQARAKENQTVQLFKSDSDEGTGFDYGIIAEGNVQYNTTSITDRDNLNISLDTLIEYAQQDGVTLHMTYTHNGRWYLPVAQFNDITEPYYSHMDELLDTEDGKHHASVSLSKVLEEFLAHNDGKTINDIEGFGIFGNASDVRFHEVWLEGIDEVIIEEPEEPEEPVKNYDDYYPIYNLEKSYATNGSEPDINGLQLVGGFQNILTSYVSPTEMAAFKKAIVAEDAMIKITYTGDADLTAFLQANITVDGTTEYPTASVAPLVVTEDENGVKTAIFDLAELISRYNQTQFNGVYCTLDNLQNFSLAGNGNTLQSIEIVVPGPKPEAKPVTNLDGQIAVIVGVNNENNVYPAIASSPSNGSTNLVGANLDSFVIGADGKPSINDNDYASNIESNRIVWQFIAEGEPGSYYIKASNYYNDNGVANNAYAGYYLNITSTGLSLSETPQAIEVVSYETLDAKSTINDVVCLRVKENDTYYYVNLNGNDGNNDFQVGTLNEDNRASHLVIVDTLDENVLKLREDIDALPLTSEFNDIINSIAVSGGEAGEKAGYDQRVAKREEIRAAAVAAKKLYDQLVKEYADATDVNGNPVNEVALLKNLIGKERIEKLLELEWLYRETPNLVNAVDVDVKVKVFNYDASINDHLFHTNTSVSDPETVGFKFYNASSNQGASDEYRFPGSWNTAPGQGEGSSPVMSQMLGEDGYPLILEVPAVIGKEGENNDQDNYENVAVTNGSLGYLFDGSHQVGSEMTDGGGLFQQDAEGYYYYYSDTNAAYFNPVTNRFELYDVVTRPVYESNAPSADDINNNGGLDGAIAMKNDRLSNFLPFNEILEHNDDGTLKVVDGEHVPKVIYDYPDSYSDVYGDIDYSMNGNENYYIDEVISSQDGTTVPTTYVNDRVDLWFGMTLEYDFFIPQDGKTNGNDMIFEFHGDDDVLVYVDDVLLLDITGCHAAMDGYINFATGKVVYQNNTERVETTIQKIFQDTLGSKYNSRLFEGDTFKDYTIHDLKFFFLERGGSISYSGMRFNLPPIPDYNLMVAKELYHKTGINKAESNEDFTFRVVKASAPDESLLPAFTPFDIYEDGVKVDTGVLDGNGLFTIKAGQVAVFPKIEGDELNHELYIVQELLTAEQDQNYGKIDYRTDSTEGGTLKDVISVSTAQVLSYYRNLLYGNANARAGETIKTVVVNGKVISGFTTLGVGVGNDRYNPFSGLDVTIDTIKDCIKADNVSFNVNYSLSGWHNPLSIDLYYEDNSNSVNSLKIQITDNNDGTAQVDLSDIKSSIDVDSIIGFVLTANSENLTISEAYFEVPTTSSGSSCNGNHTVDSWTKTDDNNHSGQCSVCGVTVIESHSRDSVSAAYNNHTYHCNKCNSDITEDHNTIYSIVDDQHHGVYCDICGGGTNLSHEYNSNHVCTLCNHACAHSSEDSSVTLEATCTTTGITTYTCVYCGNVRTEEIAATGHTDGDSNSYCDTCGTQLSSGSTCQHEHTQVSSNNNNSITHDIYCNDCRQVIRSDPHTLNWTVEGNQHTGRCSTNGCSYVEHHDVDTNNPNCTICNNGGETPHEHSYTSSITTPATCQTEGVLTYTCSCGDTYTEAISVDPNAHNGVWNYNSDQHWQTCSICSQTVVSTGAHTLGSEYGYDSNSCWKTCTECGYRDVKTHVFVGATDNGDGATHTIHCSNCEHDASQAHQWNSGETTVFPSYESAGVRTYTCITPGCLAIKTTDIPKLETIGEVTIDGVEYITYSTKALELNEPDSEIYASTVIFENRLSTDPSTLKVTKTGEGIDANEEFDMQILIGSGNIARALLSPLKQGTSYIIREDGKADIQATVGANGIITLKVNQTAIIEGLAPGIFVEVVEILGSGQNYTPTYSGTIEVNVDTQDDSKIGENGTAVIGSGDTVHITVNNTKNEGKVIIPVTKILKDMQGSTATFNFKVEHGTWNGSEWITEHAHDGTSISFGTLWGDQTITTDENNHIVLGYNTTNTPNGNATYQYKIYEQNAGDDYVYDDTFYIVEVQISNYQAKVTRVLKNGTENVQFNFNEETDTLNTDVISFTNYTTAKLRITKSVIGTDKSGVFTFNAVVTGDVTHYLDENSTEYTFEFRDGNTVIEFNLENGESIVLNLPNYAYVYIDEVDAQGCSPSNVLIQDNKVITQEGTNGKAHTVGFNVSPNYTTYVNYTNVRGCVLPKTGSALTPNHLYIAGGLILLLAISAVLLYNKINCRKEGRASS